MGEIFIQSTPDEQASFIEIIRKENIAEARRWIKNHRCLDIEEKTIADLRALAQRYCITNYSRLDRMGLIQAIKLEIGELV